MTLVDRVDVGESLLADAGRAVDYRPAFYDDLIGFLVTDVIRRSFHCPFRIARGARLVYAVVQRNNDAACFLEPGDGTVEPVIA